MIPKQNYLVAPQKYLPDYDFADRIINTVTQYKAIDLEVVKTKKRTQRIVYVRHLLCYFLANFSTLPLKEIADKIGVGDHTTVIHGRDKIRNLKGVYDDVQQDCAAIFNLIAEIE